MINRWAWYENHLTCIATSYFFPRSVIYMTITIVCRDLKPGNLLVNSNCLLKICDFGFARAVEPDPNTAMTLEVVTQYYRAPELLAGCKHYDTAIDMWSVGCILAELLGRKILFEASTPDAQVFLICISD